MCSNIRPLNNFEPPATNSEVHDAALQYVRKIAGTTKPSKANEEAFNRAVHDIAHATEHLLETWSRPRRRRTATEEAAKARARRPSASPPPDGARSLPATRVHPRTARAATRPASCSTPADLDDAEMQRIAAEVGYSETAFLRATGRRAERVRRALLRARSSEVPFCGHATIASAVALAERRAGGRVDLPHPGRPGHDQHRGPPSAGLVAELTSVAPRVADPPDGLVAAAWTRCTGRADDLDPGYPAKLANAGAEHLILVTRTHERLADLDYDFDALAAIMDEHGLITLQLIWPKSRKKYFARNPFPQRRGRGGPGHRCGRGGASAATCASWARSATRRRSPSARAPRWVGRARSRSV